MKQKTKLLFIVAFIALVLPLFLTAGSAQAVPYPADGASITTAGQWKVTDPGYCTDGVNNFVDAAHGSFVKARSCTKYSSTTYPDSATCTSGLVDQCTDGSAKIAADCAAAGYNMVKSRKWNSIDGGLTSACFATFTNERKYGSSLIGDDAATAAKQDTVGTNQCLHCHNEAYMDARKVCAQIDVDELVPGCTAVGDMKTTLHRNGTYFRAMDGYMMSGHKNVLRKVVSGSPMGGPFFTKGLLLDPQDNPTAAYTGMGAGTKYIYNSWFSAVNTAKLDRTSMSDPTTVSQVSNATGVRDCFYCHTGGYDLADGAPSQIYPLSTEFSPAKKWAWNGVQCYACHRSINVVDDSLLAATDQGHHSGSNGIHEEDLYVTAMCVQCHRMEDQKRYDLLTDADEPLAIEGVENHHANFGAQFLNSPHARFSGTYGQITDATKYNSYFRIEFGGSCTSCHDVHYGTVDPDVIDPTDPTLHMKVEGTCGISCHTQDPADPYNKVVGEINHPQGPGTPLDGNLATEKGVYKACVTCHMGGGLTQHYFRINTDQNYETFTDAHCSDPTYTDQTTCEVAGKTWVAATVNTYDDPNKPGFNAVGMDMDLVCGQCHGGSKGVTGTKLGAPYITKANLSTLAVGMHNASGTVAGQDTPIMSLQTTTPPVWGESQAGGANSPVLPPSTGCNDQLAATGSLTGGTCADTQHCDGPVGTNFSISAAASQGGGNVFVNWGDGSAMDVNASSYTHSYGIVGKYQITQTVTNPCGYRATRTYIANVSGGNNGKGTITLSFTGAAALTDSNVTYKVTDGTTIVTSGQISFSGNTVAATRTLILDGAVTPGKTYGVTVGYQGIVGTADTPTFKTCAVRPAGTLNANSSILTITGPVNVITGADTPLTFSGCN